MSAFRLVLRLSGLFLLSPLVVAAAEEDPYFAELPTVLTASRLPQPVNAAPGAVTVIDRDTLRAAGYRDLVRLLRFVPGMQLGQERGHSHWVTYHGLGNNYPSEMQILIDGRSVYSPAAFGGMDWSALPLNLDDIERIEVLRGSNPATFGANAFLGVINIITRHSAQEPGARVSAAAGHRGVADLFAGGAQAGENVSWRISARSAQDDGWTDMFDDNRVRVASLRGGWRVTPDDEIGLRLGASSFRRLEGYPGTAYDNNAVRTARGDLQNIHLQWIRAHDAGSETRLNYYHNEEHVQDAWTASAPPTYPVVPANRNRRSTRDHLEFQRRSAHDGGHQSVWGAELRRDHVDAPYLYAAGVEPVDLGRLFGNFEWRARRDLNFNFGAAAERYSGERLHLAPRLFANWQAAPAHSLRIGYARAWQQRPTFEKEGDVRAIDPVSGDLVARPYVPNPQLRQPRIDSVELGYVGRLRGGQDMLDVRLFHERIAGFILRVPYTAPQSPMPFLSSTLGSAQYVNAGEVVRLTGIEYEYRVRPWSGAEWALTHTLIDRNASPEIRARTAPYFGSLRWQQQWGGGWSSRLGLLRMGPTSGGDGFVPLFPYTSRAYTTLDARLAWRTRVSGRALEISANAINLGERHQEIADRSMQAVLPAGVVANPVSPTVWLGVNLEL